MPELIPSILVEDHKEFERRLRLVDEHVRTVHVDILDGTLFPHVSWHDARAVGEIVTPVAYELHLMVENPLPIIEEWKAHVQNLERAIIHAEIDRQIRPVLERIKQWYNLEAGLALNPETPVKETFKHMKNLDMVLMMGVHPGKSGQAFIGEPILDKIRELHKEHPALPISCDGGVTPENADLLLAAGCSQLVSASCIFSAKDPKAALASFTRRISQKNAGVIK